MTIDRSSTETTDMILDLRRGPGLVVLSAARRVLYMDPALSKLIREMNAAEQGTGPSSTDDGVLSKALNELCTEIIDALLRRTKGESWVPLSVTQLTRTKPLLLLRGFGLPHADGIQHSRIVVTVDDLGGSNISKRESASPLFQFTRGEQHILDCMTEGLITNEIADVLNLSEETIRASIKHMMLKTHTTASKPMLAKIRRERHRATKKVRIVLPKRR